MRIIGDIHGNIRTYINITRSCKESIQIGDFAIHPQRFKSLDIDIDPYKHKHFFGNHDYYNCRQHPISNLGDYGKLNINNKIGFFMRGAWSIDWQRRIPGFNWFEEEELTQEQLFIGQKEYVNIKPEIMLSHDCPFSIQQHLPLSDFAYLLGYKTKHLESRTNLMMDEMFKKHKPKLWVFGHYHVKFDEVIDGTRFVCLRADSDQCTKYLDINS